MWGGYESGDLVERVAKQRKDDWRLLRNLSALGQAFVECLEAERAFLPSGKELGMMRKQFVRLAEGTPLTLTSVICPDYGTRDGVYTFDHLGDGIGLVAKRALEVHLKITKLFKNQEVEGVVSELIMADQEINEANCRRVGLNSEEFLCCLRRSQATLQEKAAEYGMSLKTPLMTELDPNSWVLAKEAARVLIEEFSSSQIGAVQSARSRFLEKWAGRHLSYSELAQMVKAQGEEYIAVGKYIARPDRIILGLDAPPMATFVRRGARDVSPVVYFRRADY